MFPRKSELKKKTPNIARATSSITVFAPANVGFLKSDRSSIGTRCRSSRRTKVTSAAAATAKLPRMRPDVQP